MRATTSTSLGSATALLLVFGALLLSPLGSQAQEVDRAEDRGSGIPVSMFGTYVEEGEFLFYPFFEYYTDANAEYAPNEYGYGLDQDFRGKYEGHEWLVWFGYGISDRWSVELEAAYISATLERSPNDPTDFPQEISESGIGDVEGQIRYRWTEETDSRPEFFSFFETVFPLQKDKLLIGTRDWEFKLGTGVVRGFGWGTMTFRVAAEYDGAENKVEPGEFAIEYLNRLSPSFRIYGAFEGSEDEIEFIPELQWFIRPDIFLKLNSAVGVTSKATDWAPEIGVMFSF